jgi:hypothetical protein
MTTPATPDPLGRGLLLDDGDLVFDNGVLAEVTGLANLTQALTVRVLTPFGSDRFNTGYGLDVTQAFTLANSPRTAKDLLRLSLVATLGTDPRVTDVRRVTFDDDPERLAAGTVAQALADTARLRRSWAVEAEVDTLAGTPVTVRTNVEV